MNIVIETEINAPAETVWKILAHQFADIASWSSTVDQSAPIGMDEVPSGMRVAPEAPIPGRETKTKAATLREILVEYSDADRTLTFLGDGLPKVIPMASDRQTVEAIAADRCRVTFDVTMELRFPVSLFTPLLKKRIGKRSVWSRTIFGSWPRPAGYRTPNASGPRRRPVSGRSGRGGSRSRPSRHRRFGCRPAPRG